MGREERQGKRECDEGKSLDVAIEMEQPTEDSSFEEVASPDSHVTKTRDHMTTCKSDVTKSRDHMTPEAEVVVGIEETTPVLEGTLILTPRRGSDTEIVMEKREEDAGNSVGGVNYSSSAHWPLLHQKSSPIPIIVSSSSDHYIIIMSLQLCCNDVMCIVCRCRQGIRRLHPLGNTVVFLLIWRCCPTVLWMRRGEGVGGE